MADRQFRNSRATGSQASANRQPSAGITLNLCRVEFSNAEVSATIFPYTDDALKRLRTANRATHVFKRSQNEIVGLPFVANPPDIGGTPRTLGLYDHLRFAAALVQNALLHYLLGLPRRVYEYRPLSFTADENLVASVLDKGQVCPDWLSLRALHEVEVRVVAFDRMPAFVGICFNSRSTRVLDLDCQSLLALGLDLSQAYVGTRERAEGSEIEPIFRLAGRVASVQDNALMLSDCRPDRTSVAAGDAYLEGSWSNFNRCMTHAFGASAGKVQNRLDERLAALRSGRASLQRLRKIRDHFAGLRLELLPGCAFSVGEFLSQADRKTFPRVESAPRPVYVFGRGDKTDTWHDRGIRAHGPYMAHLMTPTRPRICVICQDAHKGRVEQFVRQLLHGVSGEGRNPPRFGDGFIRRFRLEDADTQFFTTRGPTVTAYRQAVVDAVKQQTASGNKWNLALVQIEDRFHGLYGEANPYFVSKAALLTHQIPVQEFLLETAEMPPARLAFALNNMALASYAKLGGIPWLIRASQPMARELVIGIGSAKIGESRLGASERVVGITTVFTGDGNYCLSTVSEAVPFDRYEAALVESLKETMGRLAKEMSWQKGDHVRLVFHAFKPFKTSEADAVKAVIAALGDFDVEYAFLHIIEDHPYRLFDEGQEGVRDFESRQVKGQFAAARGEYLRLSGSEMLMSLVGPNEVKRPQDGMPRPLQLRLGRDSGFTDITYLARQVFTFSCHSWRSYFPSPLPVTILYSELIAKLLGNLDTLPGWDSVVMAGRIRETRWFL